MNIAVLNEAFSSSSSSDESDEELMNFINMVENKNRCTHKKPRVANFIETVVYMYNNEEFQESFRNIIIFLLISVP